MHGRTTAVMFLILCAAGGLSACGEGKEAAKAGPPPVPVRVVLSTSETVPVVTEFAGRVQAYRSVEIMARVEGILEKRHFVEGTEVRKGDLLYTLERAPFEAALRDAEAMLAKQKATAVNAASRESRLAPLVKENAISQQEYDNAVAAMKESEAAVLAAESQVERARLNLGYTTITATENGRVGRSELPEGRLVGKGSPTRLTVIDRIDPIYVSFTVSDRDIFSFRQAVDSGDIKQRKEALVQILMPDGSPYPQPGRIDFADLEINQSSGAMTLRAVVPNQQRQLLPGMFARVELTAGDSPNTVLVPQQAVIKSATGHSVWVVNAEGKAERRDVVVGAWQKEKWAIAKGLGAGEKVIVEGVQKLTGGATVAILPPAGASTPAAVQR